MREKEYFPDGTVVDSWFYDTRIPELSELGKPYILTEYHIADDGNIHTAKIQALIDLAAENGGGVIVVPEGTFRTGALFFKQGVHLYVSENGVLMGSDDPSDYPLLETRIEGENCTYFSALINVNNVDGFVMCGKGTIDGNGLRAWKSFWLRCEWNPKCTNKDEQRPRLVHISHCSNVLVADLHLQNSHFWTNHIYYSHHIKYLNCHIFSPESPVPAPSTDAIDIDVCSDFLVKNCYMEVNDDSVVLKGGKGPWADKDPNNGTNERILIEDCIYGFCHGCLTCGSESVHNKNVIMRRIQVKESGSFLWLKMRPDTPQLYEYITIEDVEAKVYNCITIKPWTQFYDLKDRKDIPMSYAKDITIRNCKIECETFFNVQKAENQYYLSHFTLENLNITGKNNDYSEDLVDNAVVNNVNFTPLV